MHTVDVILDGTITPGADLGKAAAALAQLTKLSPEQARALLSSGTPKTVRRGVTPEEGEAMVQRFMAQGISASLRSGETPAAAPSAQKAPPKEKPRKPVAAPSAQKAPPKEKPRKPVAAPETRPHAADDDTEPTDAPRPSLVKSAIWALILGGLLLLLLIAPIRMGTDANRWIPVIGQAEAISKKCCDRTLVKATAAYATTKALDTVVSTAQRIEVEGRLPAVLGGLGMTFAPFEVLAAVNDALGRVGDALYSVMALMMVEKLTIGLISWVCFKACMPLALLFGLLHIFTVGRVPWAKPTGLFLAKTAVVTWLFFPSVALVTGYVEHAYLDGEYERTMEEVERDKAQLAALQQELEAGSEDEAVKGGASAGNGAAEEDGWWDRTKETVSHSAEVVKGAAKGAAGKITGAAGKVTRTLALVGPKLKDLAESADRATDRLFHLFCIFAVTTVVIPLAMLFVFCKLLGMICADYHSAAQGAPWRAAMGAVSDGRQIFGEALRIVSRKSGK